MTITGDGTIAINKVPSVLYRVDVNGSLNTTSLSVGGNLVTGSKWGASGVNIFYDTGNVGIGTNNPVNILQVGDGGRLRIANGATD